MTDKELKTRAAELWDAIFDRLAADNEYISLPGNVEEEVRGLIETAFSAWAAGKRK